MSIYSYSHGTKKAQTVWSRTSPLDKRVLKTTPQPAQSPQPQLIEVQTPPPKTRPTTLEDTPTSSIVHVEISDPEFSSQDGM